VVDLARQVAEGLAVIEQVQTPTYRQLAQQRLTASSDRLQVTHAQLQQLQDQVTLASLDSETGRGSLLPQGLQTLIAANRDILESNLGK
jgi:tRNA A37 threonylcarbamoyladenosine biosynthesis protein TsaE